MIDLGHLTQCVLEKRALQAKHLLIIEDAQHRDGLIETRRIPDLYDNRILGRHATTSLARV
jgi:hypothetical protein